MKEYIPEPPQYQPPPSFVIPPNPAEVFRWFGCCERAQTVTGYSPDHATEILYVVPCKTWACRTCAEVKIKRMACIVRDSHPNRLLTLTVNPALHVTRKESWDATRKEVPILIRRLRQKFGQVEYLRVTEVTQAGWPHYHLLVRSAYIPHAIVKKYWSQQTGAYIVDLRQVKQTFSAYKYLVKYLSKLHRIEWTARHVSMSRGFNLQEKWKDPNPIDLKERVFLNSHPAHVAMEYYEGVELHRIREGAYAVGRSLSRAPAEDF